MNIRSALAVPAAALALGLLASGPALAQHEMHSFSGGGHFASGGGHAEAPHMSAPRSAAPRFAPGAPGAHVGFVPRAGSAFAPVAHQGGIPPRFAPGVAGGGWHGGAGWGGGYWHGGYWPGVYFGPDFAWFLPVLPAYYTTYWWGGVPYYYYDDAYYTWSPGDNGYVATTPPPAAGSNDNTPPASGQDAASPNSIDGLFAYPKNGQSDDQQATDKSECSQWAGTQSGSNAQSADYRRALTACLTGRGYSVQ